MREYRRLTICWNLVDAYNAALQVTRRGQLPQDWALIENNLGLALSDLAQHYEGEKAAALRKEAIADLQSALAVRTERAFPERWSETMQNLARAYELWGDRANARAFYADLLRHDPSSTYFRAKLTSLTVAH